MDQPHLVPEDSKAVRQRLQDELASLSQACRQANLNLEHLMPGDWTENNIRELRRRRAIVQAQYKALCARPRRRPVPAAAPVNMDHFAATHVVVSDSEEDDDSATSSDIMWRDVSAFPYGDSKAKMFYRKMGQGAEAQKSAIGLLRLQEYTQNTSIRRLLLHNAHGQLSVNVKAPEQHTLKMEQKEIVKFGFVLFAGVNGAGEEPGARGYELFTIKMHLANAQQLSNALGSRQDV